MKIVIHFLHLTNWLLNNICKLLYNTKAVISQFFKLLRTSRFLTCVEYPSEFFSDSTGKNYLLVNMAMEICGLIIITHVISRS